MDERDWYQFNINRAADPGVSDQGRWDAAQQAARNAANLKQNISAHVIYSAGMQEINGRPGNYLPPLSTNSGVNFYPSNSSYNTHSYYAAPYYGQQQFKKAETAAPVNDEKCSCRHTYCAGKCCYDNGYDETEYFACRIEKKQRDGYQSQCCKCGKVTHAK